MYPPQSQPQKPRKTFGALLAAAARVGMAGAEGVARRNAPAGGGGERDTGGCTPCAAMARKNAAIASRKAAGG